MKLTLEEAYLELGVAENSTLQECKTAYKRMALIHHPDKNPDNVEEAKLKFQRVATAYQKLEKHHSGAPDSDSEGDDGDMFAMDLFSMLFADLLIISTTRKFKDSFFSPFGGFDGMGGLGGGERVVFVNGVPMVLGGGSDNRRRGPTTGFRGRGGQSSGSRGRGRGATRGGARSDFRGGFGAGFPGGFPSFGGPFGSAFGMDDDEDFFDFEFDSDDDDMESDSYTTDEDSDDEDMDEEPQFTSHPANASGTGQSRMDQAQEAERLREDKVEKAAKVEKERLARQEKEKQREAAKREAVRKMQEPRSSAFRQAENGDVEALRASLANHKVRVTGFEINDRTGYERNDGLGETLLHVACRIGSVAMVEMLLDEGATLTDHDTQSRLPTHVAVIHGHVEVVRVLLDRGASIDPRDGQKRTPLFLAAVFGQVETFKFLLQRGARVGVTDASGKNIKDTIDAELRQGTKRRSTQALRDILALLTVSIPKPQPKAKAKKKQFDTQLQRQLSEQRAAVEAERDRLEEESIRREAERDEMEVRLREEEQQRVLQEEEERNAFEIQEQDKRNQADAEALKCAETKLRAQQANVAKTEQRLGTKAAQGNQANNGVKAQNQHDQGNHIESLKSGSSQSSRIAPVKGKKRTGNEAPAATTTRSATLSPSSIMEPAHQMRFESNASKATVRGASPSPEDASAMIFDADLAGLVGMGFSVTSASQSLKETGDFHRALEKLLISVDTLVREETAPAEPERAARAREEGGEYLYAEAPLADFDTPDLMAEDAGGTNNSTFWKAQLKYGTDYGPSFSNGQPSLRATKQTVDGGVVPPSSDPDHSMPLLNGSTTRRDLPSSRSLRPCHFWAQGTCARGDSCTFSHSTLPERSTKHPVYPIEALCPPAAVSAASIDGLRRHMAAPLQDPSISTPLAPQPRKPGRPTPYVFPLTLPRVSTPSQAPKPRRSRLFGNPRRGSAASLESEGSVEEDVTFENDAFAEFLSLIYSRPAAIVESLSGQRNHHGIPPLIRRKSSVPKIFMTADDEDGAPPPQISDIAGRPELNRTPFRPEPAQNSKKEESGSQTFWFGGPAVSSPITRARNPVALNSPFTQRKRAVGNESVQPLRIQPLKADYSSQPSPVGPPNGAELGLLAPSPPPMEIYMHGAAHVPPRQVETMKTVPLKSSVEEKGGSSKPNYRGRSLSAGDIFSKLFRQAP
ncbi:hypothetical protein HDU93_002657 [Gonapodya sp. JEL0774]|nr:hypothetical protein HDU93_002657 [Gonapodya sp. JEL0774]